MEIGELTSTNAMNLRLNTLAQPPGVETVCEFCYRPWFGPVAYCPYCGRKSSCFTSVKQEPGDRLQSVEAPAIGPASLAIPTGEPPRQEVKPAGEEPRETPLEGVPIVGRLLPDERNKATASKPRKAGLTHRSRVVIAGIGAVLLWMAVKLPAPRTDEATPPPLPKATSRIASQSPAASMGAAQAPVQVPSVPPRTATAVPARPRSSSLCSAAHEAAGLCKSQK